MTDLESLNKIKNSIKNADASKVNYWAERLGQQLKGYVQIVHGLHIFKPLLYRIIRHNSSNKYLIKAENYSYFSCSGMLWCPRRQSCARANLPFERRLYMSTTIETAMRECNINDGDEFTLTKIKPKDIDGWYSLKPVLLGFLEYEKVYPDHSKEERKVVNHEPILAKFLSDSFIEDTDHSGYCFTQLIASKIFTIPGMKCIIYPSTKYPGPKRLNIAYKADDAEKDLEFEWAKVCRCIGGNKHEILYQYEELSQPPFQ
jgi:hypothetical protein